MLQYTYRFMSDRARHLCKIIIRVEVGERLPMAKAKALGQVDVEYPVVLVPSPSIPSTDARSRASGSSALVGTSRKGQMGRMARSALLREEGLGDRGGL